MVSWILAALHLIALGIGFWGIAARVHLLRGPLGERDLRRIFVADTAWGIAAALWISSGLVRAFTAVGKGPDYYLADNSFMIKMGLLVAILLLEVWPMTTLIRWRIQLAKGVPVDTTVAGALSRVSLLQAVLVIAMVFAATAMARGVWH